VLKAHKKEIDVMISPDNAELIITCTHNNRINSIKIPLDVFDTIPNDKCITFDNKHIPTRLDYVDNGREFIVGFNNDVLWYGEKGKTNGKTSYNFIEYDFLGWVVGNEIKNKMDSVFKFIEKRKDEM